MFSVRVYAHMHRSVVGVGLPHSLTILSVRQDLSMNLQLTDFVDWLAKNPLGTILSPRL